MSNRDPYSDSAFAIPAIPEISLVVANNFLRRLNVSLRLSSLLIAVFGSQYHPKTWLCGHHPVVRLTCFG